MNVTAVLSLLIVNVTLPLYYVGKNGTMQVEIEGATKPNITVDFGDANIYSSYTNASAFQFLEAQQKYSSATKIQIVHQYERKGTFLVIVSVCDEYSCKNVTSFANVVDHAVQIKLVLLSSPLVALLEEVVVKAEVKNRDSITFEWDFGDETGGQYTTVKSYNSTSIARHSYGVADVYTVSVKVYSEHEEVIEVLGQTIHAVEPIEQLNLQPLSGYYSAALIKAPDSSSSAFETKPVLFEARLWRGSDVVFIFDFGDGFNETVSAVLDVWSVIYGVASHVYNTEGSYQVSVIARNPLGDVKKKLAKPLVVQHPPQGLALKQRYYIIPPHAELQLDAVVSQGTNVSFEWTVGGVIVENSGTRLIHQFDDPGIYTVTVEAYNSVTDAAYGNDRPITTAQVYVQEVLQDVKLCIVLDSKSLCDLESLDLPLDRDVVFEAVVSPPVDAFLHFTWNLGLGELKRTSQARLSYKYRDPGWYWVNVSSSNHISSVYSNAVGIHLIEKLGNLTAILTQGPNLVDRYITYSVFYWFGTDLTFQWNFGDDTAPRITNISSVEHSYKSVGEYNVTVNVWNKFSHASITTNMFILHYLCLKPELFFLDQSKNITVFVSEEIFLEVYMVTSCETYGVAYEWTLEDANTGKGVDVKDKEKVHQRSLLLPGFAIPHGIYVVKLKVSMIGTVVHVSARAMLHVVQPVPVVTLKGGLVRWAGKNDSVMIEVWTKHIQNTSLVEFEWKCSSLLESHMPCFLDGAQPTPSSLSQSNFVLPVSLLDMHHQAVVINVSLLGLNHTVSASQVIEISEHQHSLLVFVECITCSMHAVGSEHKLVFRAGCDNCDAYGKITYSWKIWLVQDEQHDLHFSHYKCVHADGSTFFIMAPNSTNEMHFNSTSVATGNYSSMLPSASAGMKTASYDEVFDSPSMSARFNRMNMQSDTFHSPKPTVGGKIFDHHPTSILNSLMEGDAYTDESISLSEGFFDSDESQSVYDYPFYTAHGPQDSVSEEGLPGESGSAAARDQSQQRFHVSLSEDIPEDHILEGTADGRMNSGVVTTDENEISANEIPVDPLKELGFVPKVPHLVRRPKVPLILDPDDTTTGFHSKYLILKPNVLRVGKGYMVQAYATATGNRDIDGTAMEYIKLSVGPVNGRCTLMPMKGQGLEFLFRLHCMEWKSDHPPLFYELTYSLDLNAEDYLIYFGLNSNVKFVLPPGLINNNHSVYLNVIVRDERGSATRVCSLTCKVTPLEVNLTVENYIHNQTYHVKGTLKKLLGEKHNQAVLQRIQAFVSTLNIYPLYSQKNASAYSLELRKELRRKFLEIMDGLIIYSKAESVQLLSTVGSVISVHNEVEPFHLNMAMKILSKIIGKQHDLGGKYPVESFQHATISSLSSLGVAANHMVSDGLTGLLEVLYFCKSSLTSEVKSILRSRLMYEEPLQLERPGWSFGAYYGAWGNLGSFSLTTKHTVSNFPCMLHFLGLNFHSDLPRCVCDDCHYSKACVAAIAEEYTLLSDENFENWSPNLPLSVISFKFFTCEDFDAIPFEHIQNHFNLTTYFKYSNNIVIKQNFTLENSHMNIHVLNITNKLQKKVLQVYIQLLEVPQYTEPCALTMYFSYHEVPNFHNHLLKFEHKVDSEILHIHIPPEKIESPGLYYLALAKLDQTDDYLHSNDAGEISYQISASTHWCVQKMQNIWTETGCRAKPTSDYTNISCSCHSLNGISLFTMTHQPEFAVVAISSLSLPYHNFSGIIFLLLLYAAYIVFLIPNYYSDRSKCTVPKFIPLKGSKVHHIHKYLITLNTGPYCTAGTTSMVYIVLYGEKAATETKLLNTAKSKMIFFRGSSINFILSTEKSLGPLTSLEVWHNNSGSSPSWYLSSICVKDCADGNIYNFPCNKWLSATKDDMNIEKQLLVSSTTPSVKTMFWEHLVNTLYNLNMWNSLTCSNLYCSFTGIQKLSSCLCFILSCGAVIAVLAPDFLPKGVILLNLSPTILSFGFIVGMFISIIELVPATLLSFSQPPSWNIFNATSKLLTSIKLESIYCWLHGKYSFRSSTSSPSTYGSDSLFSSYASSVDSNSEVFEVDRSFEKEEDLQFSDDLSQTTISESNIQFHPLQKSLMSWQTFEHWLKEKQCIDSDKVYELHMEVFEKYQEVFAQEVFAQHKERTIAIYNRALNSTDIEGSLTELDGDTDGEDKNDNDGKWAEIYNPENRKKPFLFLLYYVGWIILGIQIFGASYFTLTSLSSLDNQHFFMWISVLSISICSSCFIFFPTLCVFISLFLLLKSLFWLPKSHSQSLATISTLNTLSAECKEESNVETMTGHRWLYFMNYLRPPTETTLMEARKSAFRNRIICAFYSGWCRNGLLLLLLCLLLFPFESTTYFYQKTSLKTAFYKSSLSGVDHFWHWMKEDVMSAYYGSPHCLYKGKHCSLLALSGCVPVSKIWLSKYDDGRSFHSGTPNYQLFHEHPHYYQISSNVNASSMLRVENNNSSIWWNSHSVLQHSMTLNNSRREAELQLSYLKNTGWIANSTNSVVVKMMLFNPTFSHLMFLALFAQFGSGGTISISYHFSPLKLHQWSQVAFGFYLMLQVVFAIVTLTMFKEIVWQMLKLKKSFWKHPWNCFQVLFTIASILYVICISLYLFKLNSVLHLIKQNYLEKIIDIRLASNLEMAAKCLLGFLVFMHLIGFFRLLKFNAPFYTFVKVLSHSWKSVALILVIYSFTCLNCGILLKFLSGSTKLAHSPMIQSMKAFELFLKGYGRPETSNSSDFVSKTLFSVLFMGVFASNILYFALVRAALITSRKRLILEDENKICFNEAFYVLREKLKLHFNPKQGDPVLREESGLPVELLLQEMEFLADKLLDKASLLYEEFQNNDDADEK